MTSLDNQLWLKSWRENRMDFHQDVVNPLLVKFWPELQLIKGSRVFVPLCGKSLDMIWLAQQGHAVIGVEISPVAVKAFFQENNLSFVKQKMGSFTLWTHKNISILCGDYFSLKIEDLGKIDSVYDRAALTALPEDIRIRYVAQLRKIVPESIEVFLLTIEDANEDNLPDIPLGVDKEIQALYSRNYDITLSYAEPIVELYDAKVDEATAHSEFKVYRLTGRPDVP